MDGINIFEMIPTNIQTYANFVVVVVVGGVGVYGYYKKMRGDVTVPQFPAPQDPIRDILNKISDKLDLIHEMVSAREHREELEREYQRGREDAEDKRRERIARETGDQLRPGERPPPRKS